MPDDFRASGHEAELTAAASFITQAKRIAVLTGAGISAESGVPTFRDAGGLWEGHRPEDVATPEAFARDPQMVWRFYNKRRADLGRVKPNPGHYALAELEKRKGIDDFAVVTQNIDGLHRQAGSKSVYELHGNLCRVKCSQCTYSEDKGTQALDDLPKCDKCGAQLRPDVVWFGEMLPLDTWQQAELVTRRCDCFLVVGTSAIVFPAAGLILLAKECGARIIEINLERTAASTEVDVGLYVHRDRSYR